MRKLRLALVLPITQFVIATILLKWGDRTVPPGKVMYVHTARLICWGLNAPALLFRFLNPIGWGPMWDGLPRSILGFDTDDLFFLLGVIVVWYFVGRALDRRPASEKVAPRGTVTVATLMVCFVVLALGGLLSFAGVHDLVHPSSNNPYHSVRGLLTLIWSVSLIFLSVRWLLGWFVGRSVNLLSG